PAIFLLHGLGATGGTNFMGAFADLGEHFRVIAPDHRGHGRGLRSGRRFRLADCADDVAAIAAALGITRFLLAGYSMGGPIAQLVWHRHPRQVMGMILCATSRDFRGRWRERLQFGGLGLVASGLSLLPRGGERLVDALPDEVVSDSRRWALGELRRSDPRSIVEAAEALGRFSSRDWIGEVDIPVSVVVTERDRLVPVARQVKLASSIPTAVLHVVDGNHLACGNGSSQLFSALLLEAAQLVLRRSRKQGLRDVA
ncbi:MAG: alpha/beta fold hydrolase, partial [Actinomycetota bacterium]